MDLVRKYYTPYVETNEEIIIPVLMETNKREPNPIMYKNTITQTIYYKKKGLAPLNKANHNYKKKVSEQIKCNKLATIIEETSEELK